MDPEGEDVKDDQLLDARICWMVTDNMRGLLATNPEQGVLIDANDPGHIAHELNHDRLLIVFQNTVTEGGKEGDRDHWFALVGDHGKVHLVEHLETMCNSSSTGSISNMVEHLDAVRRGIVPDRFYGHTGPHMYEIKSYARKPLSAATVLEYVKTSRF
jgi:hypothetical protein